MYVLLFTIAKGMLYSGSPSTHPLHSLLSEGGRGKKITQRATSFHLYFVILYLFSFLLFWSLIIVVLPGASYVLPQDQLPFMLTCSPLSAGILLCYHLTVQDPVLPHSIWHGTELGTEALSHVAMTKHLLPSRAVGPISFHWSFLWYEFWVLLKMWD